MPQLAGTDVLSRTGQQHHFPDQPDADFLSIDFPADEQAVAQFEDTISKPRFYNVPAVNIGILTLFAYLLAKLSTRYHKLYTKSSIVATVCTNLVLFAIADTLAQSISAFFAGRHLPPEGSLGSVGASTGVIGGPVRLRSNSLASVSSNGSIESAASTGSAASANAEAFADLGEISDVESVKSFSVIAEERSCVLFDTRFVFRRFLAFMTWGFFMAFIQVAWYLFLNSMYTDDPSIVGVLERDLTDQLIFSPISLACFFSYSTLVIDKGTVDDIKNKLYKVYLSTLACNFCLWFPVQFINFLVMPKKFQVPFSSTIGVLWNCFLSFRNAAAS